MQQRSFGRISNVLGALCVAALAACGGGGGSSAPAVATAAGTTLSGTVAVGAPMANATVTVQDANGLTVSASVGSDGSYSGLSLAGMTGPFKVQACGLVGGDLQCFYSVVDAAGVANVTPLTHAALTLAMGKDASSLFADGAAPPSSSELASTTDALKLALAPLFAQIGGLDATVDFTSSAFAADRTGMDKLMDAVKISIGTDVDSGNQAVPFVQLEGKIGSGSVYLGADGAASGSLGAGPGLALDLRGIPALFASLSDAIGAASEGACATTMSASQAFDAAFSLNIDGNGAMTASTAPAGLCHAVSGGGLLGGQFSNPVVKGCDASGADKICNVAFDIVKGEVVFDGAELAVVMRSGTSAWKLLGRDSAYDIHVNAAVQRTLRVDVPNATPAYTRALSFDIGTEGGVQSARVYQRDAAGSAWEATPMAQLDSAGCSASPRLTMVGSSCGSTWLSLDDYNGSSAAGDALIDAFYKRGREVRIELYGVPLASIGSSVPLATLSKRVEGIPPKSAALANMPWLELDSATRDSLVAYSGASNSFSASWLPNQAVSAKDMSFCLSGDCSTPAAHVDVSGSHSGGTQLLTLGAMPASASDYKQISLYGRDRDQLGVATNYVSCQSGGNGCPAP